MSGKLRVKQILRKIVSEDLKIIVIFLLMLITIWNGFVMGMGWISEAGSSFNTPSVGQDKRNRYQDSDGDLLPDVIENAPKGSKVTVDGVFVGRGTGTNPNKKDTDGDLFTDAAEDNLGSNANSWIDPGWIWIVWSSVIVYLAYSKYVHKDDKLREYEEFEMQVSSGVAAEGSKFAHGGSSIFAKRTTDMTEDQKKAAIQQDPRFHRMTADSVDEPVKTVSWFEKQNWQKIGIQFALVSFLLIIFLWLQGK